MVSTHTDTPLDHLIKKVKLLKESVIKECHSILIQQKFLVQSNVLLRLWLCVVLVHDLMFIFSSLSFLLLWIIGFVEGFKANLWHKKFGSISSMSLEHHAKTFELRFSSFVVRKGSFTYHIFVCFFHFQCSCNNECGVMI